MRGQICKIPYYIILSWNQRLTTNVSWMNATVCVAVVASAHRRQVLVRVWRRTSAAGAVRSLHKNRFVVFWGVVRTKRNVKLKHTSIIFICEELGCFEVRPVSLQTRLLLLVRFWVFGVAVAAVVVLTSTVTPVRHYLNVDQCWDSRAS